MATNIKKRPAELPHDRNGTQLLLMQVLTLEQESIQPQGGTPKRGPITAWKCKSNLHFQEAFLLVPLHWDMWISAIIWALDYPFLHSRWMTTSFEVYFVVEFTYLEALLQMWMWQWLTLEPLSTYFHAYSLRMHLTFPKKNIIYLIHYELLEIFKLEAMNCVSCLLNSLDSKHPN